MSHYYLLKDNEDCHTVELSYVLFCIQEMACYMLLEYSTHWK